MKIVLTYLDFKGICEPIRLVLAIAGIPFEDKRVSYDYVREHKHVLPFGQVPILEVEEDNGNKLIISQSNAILRYVGSLVFPPADDAKSSVRVDIMLEALADINKALIPAWYKNACGRNPATGLLFEETELNEQQQQGVLNCLNQTILPTKFKQIESEYIRSHSSFKFLCGDNITIADVLLYSIISGIKDEKKPYCDGILDTVFADCPNLLRISTQVAHMDQVHKWNETKNKS
mgnify:CR=1 FL=1